MSGEREAQFEDRFWSNIEKRDTGCWEWTGHLVNGYGAIRRDGRSLRAHRVAYEMANGPIPDGLVVMHACDNRSCCNAAHLSVGTHADNMADRDAKGRHAKVSVTHCNRGHAYSGANLILRQAPSGRTWRYCRECKRLFSEQYRRAAGAKPRQFSEARR